MGGKIDCYLDIVSFYSYIALEDLLSNREKLAAHGVELDFHPVFLGGVMQASENAPPWKLPAKGSYLNKDFTRSAERVNKPQIRTPPFFMSMLNTVVPLRALHHVKRTYPREAFITLLRYFFRLLWVPPHLNLTERESLAQALASCPRTFDGVDARESDGRLFSEGEVRAIMEAAGSAEMKEALKKTTAEALAKGAFGMPWLCVTDGEGREEVVFGSDRFAFVYKHLGIPFRDVEILPAGESKL